MEVNLDTRRIKEMLEDSLYVLSNVKTSRFEEREKDDLTHGLLFATLGSLISAPLIALAQRNWNSLWVTPLTGLILFLTLNAIVYFIGRRVRGNGRFGELVHSTSLVWTPMVIYYGFFSVFSIACVTPAMQMIGFGAACVFFYMAIKTGMNISTKSAVTIVIGIVLGSLLLGVIGFVALLRSMMG